MELFRCSSVSVHISKNEDLEISYEVYYNMYLGSKLFYENHENVEFKLDPRLVDEFIKQKTISVFSYIYDKITIKCHE